MPKYDVAQVTRALRLVKEGGLSQQEIAAECGMGVSTLQRHITEHQKGNRPDVDVGELPPRRPSAPRTVTTRASAGGLPPLSLGDRAGAMEREADGLDQRAVEWEKQASEMRAQAETLRKAAQVFRGVE